MNVFNHIFPASFLDVYKRQLEKIFNNMAPGFSYSRISNPTIEAFEKRMTVLEGGVASVACSSGMAAITNAFTNILQSGDEIVCSASLYGGSIDLFRDLESFGIKTPVSYTHLRIIRSIFEM